MFADSSKSSPETLGQKVGKMEERLVALETRLGGTGKGQEDCRWREQMSKRLEVR